LFFSSLLSFSFGLLPHLFHVHTLAIANPPFFDLVFNPLILCFPLLDDFFTRLALAQEAFFLPLSIFSFFGWPF